MANIIEMRSRTKVDLAFPVVVINSSGMKEKRRRKKFIYYRFWAIMLLLLLSLVHFIDRNMLRLPTGEHRVDLSHVDKLSDLSIEIIDSWCLRGDEHDTCACSNPLIAEGRQEDERWQKVHRLNRNNFAARGMEDLDVIFLGDSITEGWSGSFYNKPDARVAGALHVFQSLFSKYHGGHYDAMTQGISGDTTPNLLWRIQNGEIGRSLGTISGIEDELHPEEEEEERASPASSLVFWVLIGTNDLGNTGCSADMVILGIIRIVEELRFRQPSAIVVINGLLPRTSDHDGFLLQTKGKMPVLWPVIQTINTELKRYAANREQVEYFESDAFLRNATALPKDLQIDRDLMTDFIHPSPKGYLLWGTEIVNKLDSMMKQVRSNIP